MKIIYAITTLSGTIIGVGLFALPYITLQVGFWTILAYFFILGTIVSVIHLFFGELALLTPDHKRLPGFAKIYLGKKGERFVYLTSTISLLGALLAYLIVGGEFLFELVSPYLGGSILFWTFFYVVLGSFLIFFDTKLIEKIEFWGLILFLAVLLLIFSKGITLIKLQNIFIGKPTFKNWFLPYGPILFSLWGAALIPEIEEILGKKKNLLVKIIPVSILIPVLVYLFFILIILGITGAKTTESALISLKSILGNGIVKLSLFFGIITTFTSFLTLGLTIKKILWYDLGLKKHFAWGITSFLPLFLFSVGIKKFIPVVSFVGGIMLGIEGVLIMIMYLRAFKENLSNVKKVFVFSLIFFLVLGIISEFSGIFLKKC